MRSVGLLLGLCILLGVTGNALAASPTLAPAATTTTSSLSVVLNTDNLSGGGPVLTGTIGLGASVSDTAPIVDVQFELDGAPLGPVVTNSSSTASPFVYGFSWDTTTAPDGDYTLSAVATDQDGNTATSNLVAVTVANAPAPVGISFGPLQGGIVVITATVPQNVDIATVEFFEWTDHSFVNGLPPPEVTSLTQPPYQYSWTLPRVQEGFWWYAVATDTAGKNYPSTPVSYSVTVGPPLTASITAPANGATVSGSVTVSADASEINGTVASVQFELDGAPLGAPVTTPPYQITWDSTTASNGSHTLNAVATDTTSFSYTSAPVTVTVQNAQQSQLTVTINSPANGSVVSGTIILHASTTDSANVHVAGVQFNLDGVPIPGAASDVGASSWDTTQTTNGVHILTATATDQLGTTTTSAPVTVTVANNVPPPPVPPTVSMTAPANGATISGSVPLSAGADDASGTVTSVQFLLDGNALGAAVTAAPYAMSWDSTTVPNGSHTLAATATNNAGQSTPSAPVTVTVSNNVAPPPPTVSITAPADGTTVSGSVNVTATAAEASGQVTSVQFMLDGAPLSTALTVSPYEISWDTTAVVNGSHVLTAVAVNDANETTTSAPVTVTVNNVILPPPPTVAITSPAAGATVHGAVILRATADDISGTVTQVQFFLNGSALGAPVTTAPYVLVWHTRKYPNGSNVLTAIVTNDSGETTTSAPVSITVQNPPFKCLLDPNREACELSGGPVANPIVFEERRP